MSIIGNASNVLSRGDVSGILNAWGASQPMFMGRRLLPTVLTSRQSDYFWKRAAGERLKAPDGKRAPSTTAKRDSTSLTQDTYDCEQYRLEAEIADEHKRKYAQWDIDWVNLRAQDKAEQLMRSAEKRAADLLFNTTTWPLSGNTGLSVTNEWDDHANAVPISDILFGATKIYEACGQWPNALILADQVAKVNLGLCAQVREKLGLRYSGSAQDRASVDDAQLLSCLFPTLRKLFVGGEVYDSSPNASAATINRIWSTEYAALGVVSDGGADLTENCVGKTIAYTEEGGEFEASQYREENISSDVVRVQECVDEKVLVSGCWFLFGNMVT